MRTYVAALSTNGATIAGVSHFEYEAEELTRAMAMHNTQHPEVRAEVASWREGNSYFHMHEPRLGVEWPMS